MEDRRIDDRLTRNGAILDPRSSILDPRGLRDLNRCEFPAQTPRLFVDGVLIFRSQRPEEERPDYVNEREDIAHAASMMIECAGAISVLTADDAIIATTWRAPRWRPAAIV